MPNSARPVRQPVLFLLNSLTIGGSEKKTVAVANALSRKGWAVHIAYLNPPHTLADSVDCNVGVIWLKRRRRLDLAVAGRLVRYCTKYLVRDLYCINDYPMLYGHIAAARLGGRCTTLMNTTKLPGTRLKQIVYGNLLRRADQLVFGCRLQQQLWAEQFGLDSKRCGHIYNGVDTDRFDRAALPKEYGSLRGQLIGDGAVPVIGMVGQLLEKKGYPNLLDACDALRREGRRFKLLIVGNGPEHGPLTERVAQLGLSDDVCFLGECHDVRGALYAMDIFVLTSVSVETFSNAALEAMAMSLPVVLSDIGGATEMVEENLNGLLYSVGQASELAARLRYLLDNPDERRRMGEAGRQIVLERFSFERMLKQYEELLVRADAPNAVAMAT